MESGEGECVCFFASEIFACGEYSCALRLSSKLSDLRARNANSATTAFAVAA